MSIQLESFQSLIITFVNGILHLLNVNIYLSVFSELCDFQLISRSFLSMERPITNSSFVSGFGPYKSHLENDPTSNVSLIPKDKKDLFVIDKLFSLWTLWAV